MPQTALANKYICDDEEVYKSLESPEQGANLLPKLAKVIASYRDSYMNRAVLNMAIE